MVFSSKVLKKYARLFTDFDFTLEKAQAFHKECKRLGIDQIPLGASWKENRDAVKEAAQTVGVSNRDIRRFRRSLFLKDIDSNQLASLLPGMLPSLVFEALHSNKANSQHVSPSGGYDISQSELNRFGQYLKYEIKPPSFDRVGKESDISSTPPNLISNLLDSKNGAMDGRLKIARKTTKSQFLLRATLCVKIL